MFIYFNCKCNLKLIYIFLYSIFVFVRSLIREKADLKIKPGFNMFSNYMSLTLCGIGYIYVFFKTKPEQFTEKKLDFVVIDKIGEDATEDQNKMYSQYVIEINKIEINKKKYKKKKNRIFCIGIYNFTHC